MNYTTLTEKQHCTYAVKKEMPVQSIYYVLQVSLHGRSSVFWFLDGLFHVILIPNVSSSMQILYSGAKPHIKSTFGWTPLHIACFCGHARAVDMLIEKQFHHDFVEICIGGEKCSDKIWCIDRCRCSEIVNSRNFRSGLFIIFMKHVERSMREIEEIIFSEWRHS